MPGPEPKVAREPLHTRAIEIRGFKRADGLYDVEAQLVDTKSFEFPVAGGVRQPGEAIHSMWLRITVDRSLTIVEAEARMDAVPYRDYCGTIAPAYRKLVGLSIGPGYLKKVRELFGGIHGCTHVTELAAALATGAFQTMAGQRLLPAEKKPPQLDGCHALVTTGPAVARFYPRWYRGTEPIEPADEADHH
ncbi:MAG TPA: DUF2889 domain-containing protein [Usitatibacter sp.]|nr:DUF2889 domain-containing protein [Usitatibacter sp.]